MSMALPRVLSLECCFEWPFTVQGWLVPYPNNVGTSCVLFTMSSTIEEYLPKCNVFRTMICSRKNRGRVRGVNERERGEGVEE